jgi:arylsulfatase A-like enzyme
MKLYQLVFFFVFGACRWCHGADRPNIVWLTTEDNSASWYRIYNPAHGVPMPNVEKLAKDGLVFNRAYSCAPVCSVARSTIISGCYAPRFGVQFHRNQVPGSMPKGLKMFPWYLKKVGYYTTNNSKEDYNFESSDKEGVWDESSNQATFRKRPEGQPFFHVQNYFKTHESQMFDKLPEEKMFIVKPEDVNLIPYHPDTKLFREKYAQYLTLNHMVDQEMGVIISQLESDGLLDDTFIFHFGDHGGVLPGSKGYAHNDGLQVAMVVYVPKNWEHLAPAPRGSRINGMVEFVDLAATVLNLAGVAIPQLMDGKAFLGREVHLEELNQRNVAFGYADRFDEKYDMVRFLRMGNFSYWRSYQPFSPDGLHNFYRYKQPAFREWRNLASQGRLDGKQQKLYQARHPEQLYDLSADPHETVDLAKDPKYKSILLQMRVEMQDRVKSMPDLGFYPEPDLLRQEIKDMADYGDRNKQSIGRLVDIADLQLLPFSKAEPEIIKAIQSKYHLERYWGLIACSAFGKQAIHLETEIKDIAWEDPNPLVRTRAAEFLGLMGNEDAMKIISNVLEKVKDPIDVNLILNTVAILKEAKGMRLDIGSLLEVHWTKMSRLVRHRLKYLLEDDLNLEK